MSRLTRAALIGGALVFVLVIGALGYGLGRRRPAPRARSALATTTSSAPKPLYYYDPMVPDQHFPGPGASPMGMTLVPKFADAGSPSDAAAGVRVSSATAQSLGVRLATVRRGDLATSVDAVGSVGFDQRDLAIIQARSASFVERVYGRAPGDVVRAGAPLATVLIPAWSGAQAEYLAVKRTGDQALIAAARQRLLLLGMSPPQVAAVDAAGKPRDRITLTTPIAGALQSLDVRQGMSLNAGQTLAQVSGLSSVWVDAAVPEAQAGEVRVGGPAQIEIAAFPEETFKGQVLAILPTAESQSRTLTVRVQLANRGGRLRPGMFAKVHLEGPSQPGLLIPADAVIRTGARNLVMLAGADGRYQPVEVRIGRQAGDQIQILAGLSEGQKVVASGEFLIDSEASLTGIDAKPLSGAPMASSTSSDAAPPR